LNRTYELIAEFLNYKEPPIYGPPRTGDVLDSQADISAAREAFGYEPLVSYEEGLRRTVAWYKGEYAAHPQASI
jgi:UDP-glucose 4-epimerase